MSTPEYRPTVGGTECGRYEMRQLEDRAILYGLGELDVSNAEDVMVAQDFTGSALTVDLTGASFMDSSALAALIQLKEEIEPAELELVVTEGGQVDRLLAISGLIGHFNVIWR